MSEESATLLKQGIQALKQGQRQQARELLMKVVELDEQNVAAWLWLSGAVDAPRDQMVCLENALTLEPDNAAAQRGLEHLTSQHPELVTKEPDASAPEPPPSPAEPPDWAGAIWEDEPTDLPDAEASFEPEEPEPQDSVKVCPHCGTENPDWRASCSSCGKPLDLQEEEEPFVVPEPEEFHYPADSEPGEVVLAEEYSDRPKGLLTIGAAWMAALTLNKRGAYEHEVFGASTWRTIVGLVVGSIMIPAIVFVLIGVILTASNTGDLLGMLASLVGTPVLLVCWGVPAAIGIIIQFYLWSFGIFLIARLVGGKGSFVVHSQLLSIAYSASTLLGSLLGMVGSAIFVILADIAPEVSLLGLLLAGLFGFGIAAYSLLMNGQALSVAHRFSWIGGIGVLILSSLLYGLLIILAVLLLVMATGFTIQDLQSLQNLAVLFL